MLAIGQTIGPSSLSSCHVVERKPNLIWRVRSDARFGSFIDANLPQLEADNQEVAAGGGEPQVVKSQVKMSKLREVKHTNSKLQDTHLVSYIVQTPHVLGLRPSAPLIHASLHIDLLPAAARCEPRHRGTPLRRAVAGSVSAVLRASRAVRGPVGPQRPPPCEVIREVCLGNFSLAYDSYNTKSKNYTILSYGSRHDSASVSPCHDDCSGR